MRTWARPRSCLRSTRTSATWSVCATRSEEHTSELQSQSNLVCRLLLEKKKKKASYLKLSATAIETEVAFSCHDDPFICFYYHIDVVSCASSYTYGHACTYHLADPRLSR